jgi:hypothetical protein
MELEAAQKQCCLLMVADAAICLGMVCRNEEIDALWGKATTQLEALYDKVQPAPKAPGA